MKVKYDLTNKFFGCFSKACFVYANKEKLKKDPNKKIKGFVQSTIELILLLALTLLVLIIAIGFLLDMLNCFEYYEQVSFCIGYLFVFIFMGLCLSLFEFFAQYYINKKYNFSGTLVIDKEGITDMSENLTVSAKWDKIELIAVLENEIIVVIKASSIFMVADTNNKEKFIKIAKKYNNDVLLIDKTLGE